MQKKFQPNDKVFYIIEDDEDCDGIYISYVVTEEVARKHYSKDGKNSPSVESVTLRSFEDYNCEPVFIVDEIGDAIVGWMPENELNLLTDMAKVLFKK